MVRMVKLLNCPYPIFLFSVLWSSLSVLPFRATAVASWWSCEKREPRTYRNVRCTWFVQPPFCVYVIDVINVPVQFDKYETV